MAPQSTTHGRIQQAADGGECCPQNRAKALHVCLTIPGHPAKNLEQDQMALHHESQVPCFGINNIIEFPVVM